MCPDGDMNHGDEMNPGDEMKEKITFGRFVNEHSLQHIGFLDQKSSILVAINEHLSACLTNWRITSFKIDLVKVQNGDIEKAKLCNMIKVQYISEGTPPLTPDSVLKPYWNDKINHFSSV